MLREDLEVFQLHLIEEIVAGEHVPVMTLAGLAGQDVKRSVVAGQLFLFDGNARGMLERRHRAEDLVKVRHPGDLGLLLLPIGLVGVCKKAVKAVEPGFGRNLIARVFEAFIDGDAVSLAHRAGARAALHGHSRAGAVKGDLLVLERQHAVVLQQHEALRRGLPRKRTVSQFEGARLLVRSGLDDRFHSSVLHSSFQQSFGIPPSQLNGSQT